MVMFFTFHILSALYIVPIFILYSALHWFTLHGAHQFTPHLEW